MSQNPSNGFTTLQQDAAWVSSKTGVDKNVVLTQMVQENGWGPPASNNFGNIQYYGGIGQTGYSTSSDGTKIASYISPKFGLDAYASLLNSRTYKTISKKTGDKAQLQALQQSPWDAAHYPTIMNTYNSVLQYEGKAPITTAPTTTNTSGTPSTNNHTAATSAPLTSNKTLDWILIGIALLIIAGIVF